MHIDPTYMARPHRKVCIFEPSRTPIPVIKLRRLYHGDILPAQILQDIKYNNLLARGKNILNLTYMARHCTLPVYDANGMQKCIPATPHIAYDYPTGEDKVAVDDMVLHSHIYPCLNPTQAETSSMSLARMTPYREWSWNDFLDVLDRGSTRQKAVALRLLQGNYENDHTPPTPWRPNPEDLMGYQHRMQSVSLIDPQISYFKLPGVAELASGMISMDADNTGTNFHFEDYETCQPVVPEYVYLKEGYSNMIIYQPEAMLNFSDSMWESASLPRMPLELIRLIGSFDPGSSKKST
jgi:hypothetical protein